jgi:hypothetical protein
MRKDFFRLRPSDDTNAGRRGSGGKDAAELSNMYYNRPDGSQLFRVSFDVSQFDPSEVKVRTEQQRLIVHAKHEEKRAYYFSMIRCFLFIFRPCMKFKTHEPVAYLGFVNGGGTMHPFPSPALVLLPIPLLSSPFLPFPCRLLPS